MTSGSYERPHIFRCRCLCLRLHALPHSAAMQHASLHSLGRAFIRRRKSFVECQRRRNDRCVGTPADSPQVLKLNSTCSICCGYVVQQVIQRSDNKSTTNPQQIERVEFEQYRPCNKLCNESTTSSQQILNFRQVLQRACCTTNQ
jgi:hypothetical protein